MYRHTVKCVAILLTTGLSLAIVQTYHQVKAEPPNITEKHGGVLIQGYSEESYSYHDPVTRKLKYGAGELVPHSYYVPPVSTSFANPAARFPRALAWSGGILYVVLLLAFLFGDKLVRGEPLVRRKSNMARRGFDVIIPTSAERSPRG